MGCIVVPFMLFWFAASGYALYMGYSVISEYHQWLAALLLSVAALLAVFLYVFISISRFSGKKEIWAFEIDGFFLINKRAFITYLLAVALYIFGGPLFMFIHVKAFLFVAAFTVSVGSIAGMFYSSDFIRTHKMTVKY